MLLLRYAEASDRDVGWRPCPAPRAGKRRTRGACMSLVGTSRSLPRERRPHEHSRVTFVELFFDLVFVFAVTQISHTLLEHLTPLGLLQATLLLLSVWWIWIDTSWCTN